MRQIELNANRRIGLGRLLRQADMTFNRALRNELSKYAVTFSEFQHLWQLWQADGITQADLSRSIGVSTAASTSVLDTLEARGLIRRVRQSTDRRKVCVFLTKGGKVLQRELTDCAYKVNEQARDGLSPAQLSLFFEIVKAMIANLDRPTLKAVRPSREIPARRQRVVKR